MPSLKQYVIQLIILILTVLFLYKVLHVHHMTIFILVGIAVGFISSQIVQKIKDRKKSHD